METENKWFNKTHVEFIQNKHISFKSRCMFEMLKSFMSLHTRKCWPTYETLAEYTGWGRSSVTKEISNLEKCGLLKRVQTKQGSLYSRNIFILADELEWLKNKNQSLKE